MAKVKVTISPALLTLPARLSRNILAARVGQQAFAQQAVRRQIERVGAVASKTLLNSVKVEPLTLTALTKLLQVGVTAVHGYWIEYGRRPGPVPRWEIFKEMLREWAQQKGITVDDSGLYLIARKIRREGFPARRPLQKAHAEMRPVLAQFIIQGVRAAVQGG